MHVLALIVAAAMATATPHSMMQGHAKASPHPMHTGAMHGSAMHSGNMHSGSMKGHTPKPAATPH